MSTFITIASFPNQMDAHIAKGLLDAEGIPSFLLHEQTGLAYGQLLGDVELQVLEENVLAAKKILEDIEQNP